MKPRRKSYWSYKRNLCLYIKTELRIKNATLFFRSQMSKKGYNKAAKESSFQRKNSVGLLPVDSILFVVLLMVNCQHRFFKHCVTRAFSSQLQADTDIIPLSEILSRGLIEV